MFVILYANGQKCMAVIAQLIFNYDVAQTDHVDYDLFA